MSHDFPKKQISFREAGTDFSPFPRNPLQIDPLHASSESFEQKASCHLVRLSISKP